MDQLNKTHKEFLDTLLIDYIETHTTSERCDQCGAYRTEHRFDDCPVKVAVEVRDLINT